VLTRDTREASRESLVLDYSIATMRMSVSIDDFARSSIRGLLPVTNAASEDFDDHLAFLGVLPIDCGDLQGTALLLELRDLVAARMRGHVGFKLQCLRLILNSLSNAP
jgi:hypothetical protein